VIGAMSSIGGSRSGLNQVLMRIPRIEAKFKRTGRKDNVHVYLPLHSSRVFVFPNQQQ